MIDQTKTDKLNLVLHANRKAFLLRRRHGAGAVSADELIIALTGGTSLDGQRVAIFLAWHGMLSTGVVASVTIAIAVAVNQILPLVISVTTGLHVNPRSILCTIDATVERMRDGAPRVRLGAIARCI